MWFPVKCRLFGFFKKNRFFEFREEFTHGVLEGNGKEGKCGSVLDSGFF